MPTYVVPRWLPSLRYAVSKHYLDAMPMGWEYPQVSQGEYVYNPSVADAVPIGNPFYPRRSRAMRYEQRCMTLKERQAGCIASYGPKGMVGIWRPVPKEQFSALDSTRLHLVTAHRQKEYDPESWQKEQYPLELWQYPEWWERDLQLTPAVHTTRIDWHTNRQETDPPTHKTLEQYFTERGVPYDYQTITPDPIPKDAPRSDLYYTLQLVKDMQALRGYEQIAEFKRENFTKIEQYPTAAPPIAKPEAIARKREQEAQKAAANLLSMREYSRQQAVKAAREKPEAYTPGPLSEAIGMPLNNAGPTLTLVAGIFPTVGEPGGICFECDRRDVDTVYVAIRTGPPEPQTEAEWQAMKQLLADLTAQGK